jgi:hypothetical protein
VVSLELRVVYTCRPQKNVHEGFEFWRLHVQADSRQARVSAVQISCVEECSACCKDDFDVSGYPGTALKQLLEHGNSNEASHVFRQEPYPRRSHQID